MSLVIESGSRTIMKMTTPPTGWTKDSSFNDYSLRVVTGSVVNRTTGESFSTVFKNYADIVVTGPVAASVDATTISTSTMTAHQHFARHLGVTGSPTPAYSPRRGGTGSLTGGGPINTSVQLLNNPGGGGSHSHPVGTLGVTGAINQGGVNASINLNIKYVDTIIAIRS